MVESINGAVPLNDRGRAEGHFLKDDRSPQGPWRPYRSSRPVAPTVRAPDSKSG